MIAVLDWELSTLGHPLSDLAWASRAYHCPPGIEGVLSFQGIDLKAHGIPSEHEFVAAYCRRVGRASVPDLTYFVAFSFFRGAAIAQGIAMRAKLGNASGPDAALRGAKARQTAELGWAVAQQCDRNRERVEIVNLDAVALVARDQIETGFVRRGDERVSRSDRALESSGQRDRLDSAARAF